MQHSRYKRIGLYGLAACTAGTLAYAGFVHTPEPDAATILSCAQMEMTCGRMKDAAARVEPILAAEPDNLHALLIYANCKNTLNEYDRALELYERALKLCGEHRELAAEIRVSIAMEQSRRGRAAEAFATLDSAFAPDVSPGYVKFFYVRATLAFAAGKSDLAISDYQNACVDVEGADQSLQLDAAKHLVALGKKDSAFIVFDRLATATNPLACYESAILKLERGDVDNAFESLRKVSVKSRKFISKSAVTDADFWNKLQIQGVLPADIREWLLPTEKESNK